MPDWSFVGLTRAQVGPREEWTVTVESNRVPGETRASTAAKPAAALRGLAAVLEQ